MPTSGPISGACSCHSGCSVVDSHPSGSFLLLQLHVHIQPLRSTVITRFPATMGCPTPAKHIIAGIPGSSAYRFSRAAPNHPGESDGCFHPAASPPMAGFIPFDRLATLIRLTTPNRVRFRCGSRVCLTRLRAVDYSNSTRLLGYLDERVIPRVSSFQLTR